VVKLLICIVKATLCCFISDYLDFCVVLTNRGSKEYLYYKESFENDFDLDDFDFEKFDIGLLNDRSWYFIGWFCDKYFR
jgi:hypothetical protein